MTFSHPNPVHQHKWGAWEAQPDVSFLRLRRCVFEDCSEYQYGLFDRSNTFRRTVSIRQVEEYMQDVEEASQEHKRETLVLEHQSEEATERLHRQLMRRLREAKIRLVGELEV